MKMPTALDLLLLLAATAVLPAVSYAAESEEPNYPELRFAAYY